MSASLANLTPFQPGHVSPRRSRHTTKALQLSRKLCPEAVTLAGRVLRDESEDTRLRLKAAEIILLHGMPKGDISAYLGEDVTTSVTIHIERHARPDVADRAGVTVDAEPARERLTIRTVTVGQGDE